MKKIISVTLICLLIVSTMAIGVVADSKSNKSTLDEKVISNSLANGYKKVTSIESLFEFRSEQYLDGELVKSEIEKVSGEYFTKELTSNTKKTKKDICPTVALYYKEFECVKLGGDKMDLLWLTGVKVGEDSITAMVKWIETWLVEQYGNKISWESSAPPIITYDNLSYWVTVGYTLWTTSYDVSDSQIKHMGKVESLKGGAKSFTHVLSAVSVQSP